jgi:transcriptional regulator with XRE-family HTH domain
MTKSPAQQALCARIRAAREKIFPGRGGIARLSEQSGIPTSRLSEWERITAPSAENLGRLLKHLGCSAHWLLTGEGDPFGPEPAPAVREAALDYAAEQVTMEIVAPLDLRRGDRILVRVHKVKSGKD